MTASATQSIRIVVRGGYRSHRGQLAQSRINGVAWKYMYFGEGVATLEAIHKPKVVL